MIERFNFYSKNADFLHFEFCKVEKTRGRGARRCSKRSESKLNANATSFNVAPPRPARATPRSVDPAGRRGSDSAMELGGRSNPRPDPTEEPDRSRPQHSIDGGLATLRCVANTTPLHNAQRVVHSWKRQRSDRCSCLCVCTRTAVSSVFYRAVCTLLCCTVPLRRPGRACVLVEGGACVSADSWRTRRLGAVSTVRCVGILRPEVARP